MSKYLKWVIKSCSCINAVLNTEIDSSNNTLGSMVDDLVEKKFKCI